MKNRSIAAAAFVLAAALSAPATVVETHLNEITAPLADYVTARTDALIAQATKTKAEKKELSKLLALGKTLAKNQFFLKGDFAELVAAAKTAAALGTAAAPMQGALDQGFARAALSLGERTEEAQDYLVLLSSGSKHANTVDALITSIGTLRDQAAAQTSAVKRATFLQKADAAATKALKKADAYVVADVGAEFVPPTRRRSGDLIDLRGGRVAIPRDAGGPLAGASIVIPGNVLQNAVNVTLSAGTDFVAGRDAPAGPTLVVEPDGVSVPGAVVHLPYAVPAGSLAADLAVFVKGPPVTPVVTVTLEKGGFVAAPVSTLSAYQAGVAAPPPGQPGGSYHVMGISFATALDSSGQDKGGVVVNVLEEQMNFRIDHTASTASPTVALLTRQFVHASPHHSDSAPASFVGSVDFTWAAAGAGRFSFSFPIPVDAQTNVTVNAEGVASDDGRVISFYGRGGSYEVFAVGVKAGGSTTVADLAGRWAAVETGVQFLNGAAEPFTTRRHDAMRAFTADSAGAVTFEAAGARYETDVTYNTDQGDPVHARAENVLADSGSETWTVLPGGRVNGASNQRYGWFDKDAAILVTVFYDPTTHRAALMVASPQSATADTSSVPGLYHLAQMDVGATVGAPTTHDSTHEVTLAVGGLDVASTTSATLALESAPRDVYALSGPAPISNLLWAMTQSTSNLPASSTPLTLSLDATGTHRTTTDERWFAFAGGGRYVLGMLRGEATRLERGISLGMK